jgi:hypothetical protein
MRDISEMMLEVKFNFWTFIREISNYLSGSSHGIGMGGVK